VKLFLFSAGGRALDKRGGVKTYQSYQNFEYLFEKKQVRQLVRRSIVKRETAQNID